MNPSNPSPAPGMSVPVPPGAVAIASASLRVLGKIDDESVTLGTVNCGALSRDVRMSMDTALDLAYWVGCYAAGDLEFQKALSARAAQNDVFVLGAANGAAPAREFELLDSTTPLRLLAGDANAATLVFPRWGQEMQLTYYLNTGGAQALSDALTSAVQQMLPFRNAFRATALPICARLPGTGRRN